MTSPWSKEFPMPEPPKDNRAARRAVTPEEKDLATARALELHNRCVPHVRAIIALFREHDIPLQEAWVALAMTRATLRCALQDVGDGHIADDRVAALFEKLAVHAIRQNKDPKP